MAKVTVVNKKIRFVKHVDIVKFQILTHCYINKITLSNSELDCLTLLTLSGKQGLSEFCNVVVDEKIFKTSQTVRNFLTKAVSLSLVIKEGSIKKTITVNSNLQIQMNGNLLLNYTFAYVAQE